MEIKYFKFDPGGNITALVETLVPQDKIVYVSKKILKEDNQIEQVGFIQEPKIFNEAEARLQMMGGEFCGNASRCLALYMCKKLKKQDIKLEVSGSNNLLSAVIGSDGSVEVDMPIKREFECINETTLGYFSVPVVRLQGITHVLVDEKDFHIGNKERARKILGELELLTEEASGVINYESKRKLFIIDPFVWVRNTQTLYHETGCASGTIALAQYLARKSMRNTEIEVIQPSNKSLIALVTISKNNFLSAKIRGDVNILSVEHLNYD